MNPEPIPYADGPVAAVTELADGIATASGGAVTAGLAYGITSHIPTDQTPGYVLEHRYGRAIDLNVNGSATYLARVADFFRQSSAVVDTVVFEDMSTVHVTLFGGTSVDLSGFPKTTRKKVDDTDEAE